MTTDTKAPSRRALHAYLSDGSHDAWHDFAAENGVTVSALLEALTPHVVSSDSTVTLSAARDEAVKSARAVDAQRRRRS